MNGFEFPFSVEVPDVDLTVAVVGCGSIGQRHIRSLLQLGPRVIGIDTRMVPMPDCVPLFPTLKEAHMDIDAVVVATPAPLHLPVVREAVEMGARLFIEKPLAAAYEDAEEIARIAPDAMVGYNLRFDPEMQRFVARLPDLGRLMYAEVKCSSWLPDWRKPRDYRQTPSAKASLGGGILLEASHELDLINWIFAPKQIAIGAVARKLSDLEIDVEDTVIATMETDAGLVISLHLDFCTPGYQRRIRVVGTKGEAEWNLLNNSPMYQREMGHFIGRIMVNKSFAVTTRDGLRAMELDHLIREAAETFDKARGQMAA